MADIDITDEDTAPPEVDAAEAAQYTVGGALRALDEAESATSRANKAVEQARKAKKRAEALVLAVYEHQETTTGKLTRDDGRKVLFYTEQFRTFNIKDETKFRAWEAEQDENYFEQKTALREQIFLDEMRRLDDDKQPLPPGVVKVSFPKLKRKADTPRRKK